MEIEIWGRLRQDRSHLSFNRWKEIYEANKDVIGPNASLIKAGQVLVIPNAENQ